MFSKKSPNIWHYEAKSKVTPCHLQARYPTMLVQQLGGPRKRPQLHLYK